MNMLQLREITAKAQPENIPGAFRPKRFPHPRRRFVKCLQLSGQKLLPGLFFCLAIPALFAQNNILRGVVTYQNTGLPIEGVFVSGVAQGVSGVSDNFGMFELKFPGTKPGDVVELYARLDGHEISGRMNVVSFTEAIPQDPQHLTRLVMVKTAEKRQREDEIRNIINQRWEAEKEHLNTLRGQLDNPALTDKKRKVLSDSLAQLDSDIEAYAASSGELVKQIAGTDLNKVSELVDKAYHEFDRGKIKAAIGQLPDNKLDGFLKKTGGLSGPGKENFMVKARFQLADFQFRQAEATFLKAIAADSTDLDNLWETAYFLQKQNRLVPAVEVYKKALAKAGTGSTKAALLNNLGNLLAANHATAEAEAAFQDAFKVYKSLAEKNPAAFLPGAAMSLNNLGVLYKSTYSFAEAGAAFREALKTYRSLAEINADAFLPYVAMCLGNLGDLHQSNQSYIEATAAYQEALKIRRALAGKNPAAFLPAVAENLNNLGASLQANQSVAEAETTFREALKTYRRLAEANAGVFLPGVAESLRNIGDLLSGQLSFQEAEDAYREALQYYRALAEKKPRAYLPGLAATLNSLGEMFFAKRDMGQAEPLFAEALQIWLKLADNNPRAFDLGVCRTDINMAEFYKEKQATTPGQHYRSGALELLEDADQRLARFPADNAAATRYKSEVSDLKDYFGNFKTDSLGLEALKKLKNLETNVAVRFQYQEQIVKIAEGNFFKNTSDKTALKAFAFQIGILAVDALYGKQWARAEMEANRALRLSPDEEWAHSFLALAYLYQGKWKEAETRYKLWKDKPCDNQRLWGEIFLKDLEGFEAAGILHPDAAKAKALLKG